MLRKHVLCLLLALLTLYILLFIEKARAAEVRVTSYNPVAGQTDASPCTGASLRNLCTAAREGDRVLALSRDLLWRNGGEWRWHDKIRLISKTSQCNGVFSVEDTMHARFRKRVDLFFLDDAKNVNCSATISKL